MNLLGKSCNHSYKKFISYIISFCRKNAKFKSPKTCLKNLHRHYLAKRSINYSIIYNNTWHLGILRLILWRGAALKLASRQAKTLPECPSLGLGAIADEFGLSFWGPEIPACLHTRERGGTERTAEEKRHGKENGGFFKWRWAAKAMKSKKWKDKKAGKLIDSDFYFQS